MLGDFLTRLLILLFGYAYPAFECYKIVEKNRVEIEDLRFWCQYWILVAMITVLERVGDIFISWLPMYGELKLGIFIYLWYPKTKGTRFVYDTFFRPYIAKHETNIDRKLVEWRARCWDLIILYWQNCAEMGRSAFFDILQYMAFQSAKVKNARGEVETEDNQQTQNGGVSAFQRSLNKQTSSKVKKGVVSSPKAPPAAPPAPPSPTINRPISITPRSKLGQFHSFNQKGLEQVEEEDNIEESVIKHGEADTEGDANQNLSQARLRLRRLKPIN